MNNKELVVEFRNVTKSYGSNTLFDNFNMTVTSGEMICIAGGSGSGKSTILNLIGMFDKPDRGEIYLFGKKIPKINSKEGREVLRTKLLYIFQNFALLGDKTIDYNLDIPLLNSKLSCPLISSTSLSVTNPTILPFPTFALSIMFCTKSVLISMTI